MTNEIYDPLKKVFCGEKCNMCGLESEVIVNDWHRNTILHKFTAIGGYESTPGNGCGTLDDCSEYKFSLCEYCLDYIFNQCIIPVLDIDYSIGENNYISAEERVRNDSWREMKKEFFEEYERRNNARQNIIFKK